MSRRLRSRPSLIGLGGWLFADLLLVLSVVWLGTQSYFDPSTFEINSITSKGPSLKTKKNSNIKASKPPYLASQWYFNDTDILT